MRINEWSVHTQGVTENFRNVWETFNRQKKNMITKKTEYLKNKTLCIIPPPLQRSENFN